MVDKFTFDCEGYIATKATKAFREGLLAIDDLATRDKFINRYLDDLSRQQRQMIISFGKWKKASGYMDERVAKVVASDKFANADAKKQANMIRAEVWGSLQDFVAGSGVFQKSQILSISNKIEGERSVMMGKLTDALEATKEHITKGRRSPEYNNDLVRAIEGAHEAHFETSGQPLADVRRVAKAWKALTDYVGEEYNRLGVDIDEIPHYGLPIAHDSARVAEVSFDTWFDFIQKNNIFTYRFDTESTADARRIMESIYWNIATEGSREIDIKTFGSQAGSRFGKQFQKQRMLQIRGGQAWIKYNKQFGRHQSPVDAMINYTDMVSRDIGVLRELGPTPDTTIEALIQHAKQVGGNSPVRQKIVEASYNHVTRKSIGFNQGIGGVLQQARAIQVITKLGSTPITALSDIYYGTFARMYAGTRGNPMMKSLRAGIKAMDFRNTEDRVLAGKLGFIFEDLGKSEKDFNRFGDSIGYDKLSRVADQSTRISGLAGWTVKMKRAFSLEMLGNLGHEAKNPFGSLPNRIRKSLERYGIDSGKWDQIRKSVTHEMYEGEKVPFIDVMKDMDPELAAAVVGMIRRETKFAVPEADIKGKAMLTMGADPNGLAYAFLQTLGQFKSFGVTTNIMHGGRAIDAMTNGVVNRTLYQGGSIIGAMVTGYSILTLKDFLNNKTPRTPTDKEGMMKLAMDSIGQSGIGGLAYDIFTRDQTKFGGFAGQLAGPTASDISSIIKFATGSQSDYDPKKMAVEGVDMIDKAVPFGNMWWTKQIMDKAIWNGAKHWIDPKAARNKDRRQRQLLRERGQEQLF